VEAARNVPKFEEMRKRRARATAPPELDAFFTILNAGRYEFAGLGVFDAHRHEPHRELRNEMALCACSFLWRQDWEICADLRDKGKPYYARLTRKLHWYGGKFSENAEKLRRHAGTDLRGSEDEAAAAARHAAAMLAVRLVTEFFESWKTVGFLCVKRCTNPDCLVVGDVSCHGGSWFFSTHDQQEHCTAACGTRKRVRQFRSSRKHHSSL
jgi:hypothetical protein